MSTSHGMLEGQSMTRAPYFNGQYYSWWKNRMENYIQVEDSELWMLIKNGPLIPTKVTENRTEVRKEPSEFDADDFKKMEKNAKAKKPLVFWSWSRYVYSYFFECESAKDI